MSLQAASHGRVLPGLPVDSLHARVHSGAALGGTGPHTVISLSGRRRPWAVTRFHRAQIHSCIFGLASALLLSVLDAIATCFLSDSVKGWFREPSSIVYGNMPFDIIDVLYEISDIYACRGSTAGHAGHVCAAQTHRNHPRHAPSRAHGSQSMIPHLWHTRPRVSLDGST